MPASHDKDPHIKFYDANLNAGAPPEKLAEDFITPTARFFVRNHAPAPEITEASYRLRLGGMVDKPLELSLDELKQNFERVTLTVALQCAGNRRQELIAHAPIDDQLEWGVEAIGNATWSGARLTDVLAAAGVDPSAGHVAFVGLDQITEHGAPFPYGSSIPLEKALQSEVLLAYEMNGAPLTQLHGYPLRSIVPGYIGARSVKWLGQISIQMQPSDNYYQQVAYRLQTSADPQDMGFMLAELSVNAAILSPQDGAELPKGLITLKGYAMAGGDRVISRVQLSQDGGGTWYNARLASDASPWSWCLWDFTLDLEAGEHEFMLRAWDSAANTQPQHVREIWNIKGYMNNAQQRIRVKVV